ncbi:hypothetical protein DOU11_10605, partial [Clavibacter michiganensis subsp. michiganensis]|nr:hypothetical protein [Clavibacter michiganensis subsp. michiganensis]
MRPGGRASTAGRRAGHAQRVPSALLCPYSAENHSQKAGTMRIPSLLAAGVAALGLLAGSLAAPAPAAEAAP